MFGNTFCTICGAQISPRNTYCPQCGVALMPEMNRAFYREHQNHCTGCGSRTNPRDYYCANCGTECSEYSASASSSRQQASYPGNTGGGLL